MENHGWVGLMASKLFLVDFQASEETHDMQERSPLVAGRYAIGRVWEELEWPQEGRKSFPLCFIAHSCGQVAEKRQEKRGLCSSEEGELVELGSRHAR